eukprot:7377463-Prymnesium_polylepis.1
MPACSHGAGCTSHCESARAVAAVCAVAAGFRSAAQKANLQRPRWRRIVLGVAFRKGGGASGREGQRRAWRTCQVEPHQCRALAHSRLQVHVGRLGKVRPPELADAKRVPLLLRKLGLASRQRLHQRLVAQLLTALRLLRARLVPSQPGDARQRRRQRACARRTDRVVAVDGEGGEGRVHCERVGEGGGAALAHARPAQREQLQRRVHAKGAGERDGALVPRRRVAVQVQRRHLRRAVRDAGRPNMSMAARLPCAREYAPSGVCARRHGRRCHEGGSAGKAGSARQRLSCVWVVTE